MEVNVVLITVAAVAGAVGLSFLFVGVLASLLVALGNRHYFSGIFIFLFFPTALVYGFQHRQNMSYALKLLSFGFLLLALFLGLLAFELIRLDLDPLELISTTKFKH